MSGSAPSLGKNSVETPIGRVAECSLGTLRKIQLMGDIPQCGGRIAPVVSEGHHIVLSD